MKLPAAKSRYEEQMKIILDHLGIEYVREYRFCAKRRWRSDFYLPLYHTLIEVEGAVYNEGRHTRGKGYTEDCLKYNSAVLCGYRLLRFTSWMVGAKAEEMLLELMRREEHAEAGEVYDEEAPDSSPA